MPLVTLVCSNPVDPHKFDQLVNARWPVPDLCPFCARAGLESTVRRHFGVRVAHRHAPGTQPTTDPAEANAQARRNAWYAENDRRLKEAGYEADLSDPFSDNIDGPEGSSSVLELADAGLLSNPDLEPSNPQERAAWQADKDRRAADAYEPPAEITSEHTIIEAGEHPMDSPDIPVVAA